jgi:hypothetical protein
MAFPSLNNAIVLIGSPNAIPCLVWVEFLDLLMQFWPKLQHVVSLLGVVIYLELDKFFNCKPEPRSVLGLTYLGISRSLSLFRLEVECSDNVSIMSTCPIPTFIVQALTTTFTIVCSWHPLTDLLILLFPRPPRLRMLTKVHGSKCREKTN